MESIVTAKVENKTTPGGKEWQQVTDADGKKYSNWGKPMETNKAYQVDVEAKENNGKTFYNIKAWRPVTLPAPEGVRPQQAPAPTAPSSIESQVAFKGAIELLAAKVINPDHPNAKLALKWQWDKLGGQVESEEIPF